MRASASLSANRLPDTISTVEELEELLSRPSPELIRDMQQLDGDVIVVGVGGKVRRCRARAGAMAEEHGRPWRGERREPGAGVPDRPRRR